VRELELEETEELLLPSGSAPALKGTEERNEQPRNPETPLKPMLEGVWFLEFDKVELKHLGTEELGWNCMVEFRPRSVRGTERSEPIAAVVRLSINVSPSNLPGLLKVFQETESIALGIADLLPPKGSLESRVSPEATPAHQTPKAGVTRRERSSFLFSGKRNSHD
jgi:hypothetical protein